MALTLINPVHCETETVSGFEVCIPCASLIAAGAATDKYGGEWAIEPYEPRYETTTCDLCRDILGPSRISASVTTF